MKQFENYLTKYVHYRETPYCIAINTHVACGRRVNRLAATREAHNVTCPKCVLCATNKIALATTEGRA